MTVQEIKDRYAAVPDELKAHKIWACWAGDVDGTGIKTDPLNPLDLMCDPTATGTPTDWLTFDDAVKAGEQVGLSLVGMVLVPPYKLITISNGVRSAMCDEVVNSLDTYTEATPDGHGVQMIVKACGYIRNAAAKHPEEGAGVAISIAADGFVAMTGKATHGAVVKIPDRSVEVSGVVDKYMQSGGVSVAGGSMEYDMTDTGNARRLRDMYGDRIRYSHTMKEWYVWDGKRWAPNDAGQVKKLADNVIYAMRFEAAKISDNRARETVLKFVRRTEGHTNKENMLKECQHLDGIPVAMDDLDSDEMTAGLINCQNGIIDLRTGELLPHDPSRMMTKICGTEYDTSHRPPERFLKFLDEITSGDKEMQAYLKRCAGYTLTGTGSEQCVFFLYGMGNNGKSTLADTLASVFGSYAANTQADTLLLKGREVGGSGATGDIARLKAMRMVTCQEPDEGARLKEGLLKQLTGNTDKITARFLYGREFEFYPRFAAWISANHKPIIRGTDKGIWRRIRLIPFSVDIKEADKDLPRKLKEELPQILAWCVEGAMEWYAHGLETPAAVAEATAEYKKEMDLVASFVDQCLEIDYDTPDVIMASDMFASYIAWARANNEYEMTSKKFGMELTKKIPDGKGRNKSGVYYGKVKFTDYGRQFVQKKYTADQFK